MELGDGEPQVPPAVEVLHFLSVKLIYLVLFLASQGPLRLFNEDPSQQ